jgi:preprotein translocase subunit SecB
METDAPRAPVLRLQKLYVKDLSFESPGAPQVFFSSGEPKVKVDLTVENRRLDDDHWEVVLHVTATVASGDTTFFLVEVEHAGAFLIKDVPEEHLEGVLAVDCPTAIFPFTRQVICQATIDGGFAPFLLEPVNFLGLFQNARAEKEREPKH